jgi:hypothetical protein
MRHDPRPRRFTYDLRRPRREPPAAPPEARHGPPSPLDGSCRDGPDVDLVDEAIDQLVSERSRAGRRCGRVAPGEGRRPRGTVRPPRPLRPGLG